MTNDYHAFAAFVGGVYVALRRKTRWFGIDHRMGINVWHHFLKSMCTNLPQLVILKNMGKIGLHYSTDFYFRRFPP
jgi:hypothetical protein